MVLLHELFAQCVSKYPDKSAIVWDTNSSVTVITYSELLRGVDIVINKFTTENIRYEYVGVQLNSLLSYPAIVLGILYSKCAYVALDLKNDMDWNLNLVEKLNIRVILTDSDSALTENWRLLGKLCIHNELASVMCSNRQFTNNIKKDYFVMAYAIQTSGTTGRPKVVQVPHSCIVPNIIHLRDIFEVGPCDTVFLSSPITFDPSVVETFITLTSGACLLIAPDCIRTAPGPLLFQFLFNRPRKCTQVSILSLTPSYAACLLSSVHSTPSLDQMDPNLKILCLGGEPCPPVTILEKWANKVGKRTRLFSLYGITEVSCWASIVEVFFSGKPYPKLSTKRKGNNEGELTVQLESKNKSLKVDKYIFKEPGSIANASVSEATLAESVSKIEDLPHVYFNPDFVNKCPSREYQHSVRTNQEDIEMSSSDKNISDVPLGLPLAQTILEVRDSAGHIVSHGEGELFIGSDTRICLLDGEVIDTLEKRKVIFRATGDIVYVQNCSDDLNQSSLVMYYKGRRDGAVKRFGQWVFVEMIEAAASEFIWNCGLKSISIASACCVCCGNETGRGKLGLFVVPSEKGAFQEPESQPIKKKFVEDLSSHLTGSLPTNSWPDIIIPIEELPLSKHGKVHREILIGRLKDFLPEKIIMGVRGISSTPDDLLLNFKSLWMQYLKINREPSLSDKFLLNGGNSLLALRLVAELEDSLNYTMPPILLIRLINGTYEEACSCIYESDLSDLEHRPTNSSALIGKSDLAVNVTSNESIVVTSSDLKANKCEGENINAENDVHLCFEYTRGKKIRHRIPSKMFHTSLSVEKSPAMTEKWKCDLGKCVDASPVVLQYMDLKTIAVVGSHSGLLVAVNLRTGEQVFRCELPDRIESSACSSPCGKFIFVGCYDHHLYCISVPEGKITWSFTAGEMVKSSPLVVSHGTCVVFGSYSGFLYCVKIKDGDLLWKMKLDDGSLYSSPALYKKSSVGDDIGAEDKIGEVNVKSSNSSSICTGIILCATLSGTCAALTEKDGRILWTNDLKAPVFTSPVVYDHHAVFSSVKGRVTCFSVKSGEMVWSIQTGGNVFSSFTTVATEESKLIVFGCHDHYVYCLSGDGVLQWKTLVDSPVFATPFIFPVQFYDDLKKELCSSEESSCTSNLIAVCSTAGHLYIIDAQGGTIMIDMKVNGELFSSPVVHQNHIIFGCRDNFLYCYTLV